MEVSMFKNSKTLQFASVLVLLSVFAYCSTPVPVQKMSQANAEISLAEENKAPEFAQEQYQKAKEALLASHQQVADDKHDEARLKAEEAYNLAHQSRAVALPQATKQEKESATTSLSAADEAYAEELAKDDFVQAKQYFAAGEEYEKKATDATTANTTASGSNDPVDLYHQSYTNYKASHVSSEKAKNQALSQKDNMLIAVDNVRKQLDKAQAYGAENTSPEDYKTARDLLAKAEEDMQAGRLKSGNENLKKADALTQTVLASSTSAYALKRKEEAARRVGEAKALYQKTDASLTNKDEATSATMGTVKDYVDAAGEAVTSSENNYSQSKYEESIKDADEAINLADIITEQLNMVASAQKREVVTDNTNKKEETVTTDGDWKTYVVRKKRPADSLWRIAAMKVHYGKGKYWRKIYQANKKKIKNPNLIYPGQKFTIPPVNAKGTKPPEKKEEVKKVEEKTEEVKKDPTIIEQIEKKVEEKVNEQTEPKKEEPPMEEKKDQPTTDKPSEESQPRENVQ